jgi:hypothetical protein
VNGTLPVTGGSPVDRIVAEVTDRIDHWVRIDMPISTSGLSGEERL